MILVAIVVCSEANKRQDEHGLVILSSQSLGDNQTTSHAKYQFTRHRNTRNHLDRIQLRFTSQQIDIALAGARSEDRVPTNIGYAGRRETASLPKVAGSECYEWNV